MAIDLKGRPNLPFKKTSKYADVINITLNTLLNIMARLL